MTYAYWYLVAVFLLPYTFTVLAKGFHPDYDNANPRVFLENLEGWRKRSHWVQMNSFETFAPFAAALIIAHQVGAAQQKIDIIALAYLIFRVLYGIFYVTNKSSLRTLSWTGSLLCTLGLFLISA